MTPLMRSRRVSGSACSRSGDRKSTRLNSSHLVISYAVFCLKKKKISRTHGWYLLCGRHLLPRLALFQSARGALPPECRTSDQCYWTILTLSLFLTLISHFT